MDIISKYKNHVTVTFLSSGEMRESREESVELKGVTATGLQAVVNFAYTGM